MSDVMRNADEQWLAKHEARIWAQIQQFFAEQGRGVLIFDFHEVRADIPGLPVPAFYATAPTDGHPPAIAQLVDSYDPATQYIVVFLGHPLRPEDNSTRVYLRTPGGATTPPSAGRVPRGRRRPPMA